AAESASPDHLAVMRQTLAAMEREEGVVDADITFHTTICKATGNRICERMFSAIHQAFKKGMEVTTQLGPASHTLKFHKAIYRAIRLRQPDEARKRMTEHLHDAKALLLRASLERSLPGSGSADESP